MILRSGGGLVVHRDMFAGVDAIPLPSTELGQWTPSGRRVTTVKARGLPPVLRGIRIMAETTGTLPILVYRGDPQNPALLAEVDAGPQYELLGKKPNMMQTPFDFKAYIVSAIYGYGNAYLLKAKSKRFGVTELWPITPSRVIPETKSNTEIVYKVRPAKAGEREVELTREDLIHIPGILLDDPYIGVSPLSISAVAIGTGLAVEEFSARFFDRDATPGGLIEHPGAKDTQAAKDMREIWNDRHRGSKKAHGIGALFGGASYKQIGVNAKDAQVIEAQQWTVDQSANVIGLPPRELGGSDPNPRATPEERNMDLLQSVMPWLVRTEQALHADNDLFPDKELVPRFYTDGMLRASMSTRFEAYVSARQAGWLSINDIRRREGEPPIPDGDDYQATPVGGAPNEESANKEKPDRASEDDEDEEDTK